MTQPHSGDYTTLKSDDLCISCTPPLSPPPSPPSNNLVDLLFIG